MRLIKTNLHWFAITLIAVVVISAQFYNHQWSKNKVLQWDVYGYSQYLSSAFIYCDLKNAKELSLIDSIYNPAYSAHCYGRSCCGDTCQNVVFKYTMGNAVMMSPFYLTAHFITQGNKNFPADGYSEPYQLAVALSTSFWAIFGLIILVLLLRRWFNPVVISLTVFLITLGTNYFYYASLECGMNHIPSFLGIASALACMFLWLEKQSWIHAILFGLATGMVALIRLPDLVFGIIPAIFFIKVFTESYKQARIKLIEQAFVAIVLILLVFLPQLVYWKYASGNWFYYSYGEEKFFFNDPHIIDGLFSYKKGWLLYTPVMLFAIAGIYLIIKKMKWLGIGMLLYLIINIYVVFSWWMWWYGGSFGARSMIQSYAVLAIPLACAVQWLIESILKGTRSKRIAAIIFSIALFFLFALNLFQTFQYKRGIIHYDSMDKKAYWAVFGKAKLTAKEWQIYAGK